MGATHKRGRTRPSPHLLVSAGTLAAFVLSLGTPLLHSWDDGRFIVDNPLSQQVSWQHFAAIVSGSHFQAYHPLHLLSYWLDVPWVGANGPVLHGVNLALWLLAANLLLAAMRRLGLSPAAASIATLACCAHPAQVEVVVWATGRKDVLAMLFVSASLLLHLRAEGPWGRYAWWSRAAFVAAVLSKTTALPLPLLLMLIDVSLGRRSAKHALRQQLPSLLVAVALAAPVLSIWQEHRMIRVTAGGAALAPLRLLNTLQHHLATALWPARNAPLYSTSAVAELQGSQLLLPLLWLAAAAVALARRAPLARVALFGPLLLALPVLNLVPMYFPYQDRYLSLPLLPLAIGLGALLDRLSKDVSPPARWPYAVGALLTALLVGRSAQYTQQWQSEAQLWGHAVSTRPDAYYGWMKLGETRRGDGDLRGAIRAYRGAVQLAPGRKLGHAAVLQSIALRDEALQGLSPSRAEALSRRYYEAMDDPEALRQLGADMLRSGYLRSLELPMARALSLHPFTDEALQGAALLHFRAGRPSVGLFYARQMHAAVDDVELRRFVAASKRRVPAL